MKGSLWREHHHGGLHYRQRPLFPEVQQDLVERLDPGRDGRGQFGEGLPWASVGARRSGGVTRSPPLSASAISMTVKTRLPVRAYRSFTATSTVWTFSSTSQGSHRSRRWLSYAQLPQDQG
jgi:hypothetical protein